MERREKHKFTGKAHPVRASIACAPRLDVQTALQLRVYLARDFAMARTWADLHALLAEKGFKLLRRLNTFHLLSAPTGGAVCSCDFLGHRGADLIGRLGVYSPTKN